MIETINNFITTVFNLIVVTFLTPMLNAIKDFTGSFYIIVTLILAIIISYFLARWNKFSNMISGELGLTIMLSILLSIIFLIVGGL